MPLRFGDAPEHAYDRPFAPGASYDPSVPTPDELLGQPVGSRLARPEEILAAFEAWAELSPRMVLEEYGRTYEGRPLVVAHISSERRLAERERIQADLRKLEDPRAREGLEELIEELPAAAYLGYSIHGDETSGSDAALAVAHHLIAGQGAEHEALLDSIYVVLDPCMNPDGRARTASQLMYRAGYVPSLDPYSLHRGHWPYGRTNHYLFDMNRDWMVGVAPETRGRWKVLLDWPVQLFVDAHEMGALDTFLFYPQADPKNPFLPPDVFDWQGRFAAGTAAAFDREGWGYYTREWADAWGPMYSDAWGSLGGAVGILYEQARVGGQALQREGGEIVSYREAVHGQFLASLANLATLSEGRSELLQRFLDLRREAVDAEREGGLRAYVIRADHHPERAYRLVQTLLDQGLEVWRTTAPLEVSELVRGDGSSAPQEELEVGCFVLPSAQPRSRHLHAYLDYDPRIDARTLLEERRSLERDGSTRMYDVTAWDLGRAWDLETAWCQLADLPPLAALERITQAPRTPRGLTTPAGTQGPLYAYVVDGHDDAALRFAGHALQADLAVHVADKPFRAAGRSFVPGSLLVRRHENEDQRPDWEARVNAAIERSGAAAFGVTTGRSPDQGPDLGGGHFELLAKPRIALLGGGMVSSNDQGHVWQLLDEELRLPVSILEAEWLTSYDLRGFNVLIVPPISFPFVLEQARETLETWVAGGGTLIAFGSAAGQLAGGDWGLGTVRRRDALEDLERFAHAARRERGSDDPSLDWEALWSPEPAEQGQPAPAADQGADVHGVNAPDAADEDAWRRRFSPSGVLARADVDRRHWITAGARDQLPVLVQGSTALLARRPVETPLRLAPERDLRVAGLLWPEARTRLADSAWLTVEGRGHGQVILFAASPVFRGWFRGTARIFGNAVVLGPGAGADPATR